ncbi:alpha/beta fold hydrolase [Olivibacter sitiensis]|uniref:alpha/beta fold hydrolase n=1 Tax=Olivibacter sitiensis TaxID=376470 RepID=UPI0004263858|nr:alpha/beta hydrolase [Olivibacter sitiensis]
MKFIEKKNTADGERIRLHYEDLGQGQPIVFIHGWPSSHRMWEPQIGYFLEQGYRCIAYDRRGFGDSSRPLHGYSYDNFADDLHEIITQLALESVILVGFSMGGGEVARYFTRHGSSRISKAVLLGAVTPYLLATDDNPEGVDRAVFTDMIEEIKKDRPAFLENFFNDFFGLTMLHKAVSKPMLEYQRVIACMAAPHATVQCVKAFAETDFRGDLSNIDVPTLIIHGDADKIVPVEASGNRTSELVANSQYILYPDAPHGFFLTHKDKLNKHLLAFFMDSSVEIEGEE